MALANVLVPIVLEMIANSAPNESNLTMKPVWIDVFLIVLFTYATLGGFIALLGASRIARGMKGVCVLLLPEADKNCNRIPDGNG